MGTLSSHIKMAGPALVGIFWFAALFSPALCLPYHDTKHCFDGKMLPVNLKEDWIGLDCLDTEGNKYQENATLLSCCGCLKLTCENHRHPNEYPSMTSNWTLTPSESFCKDCNGTMYPAGAVMSTDKIDDDCKTTRTTRCVYVDVNGDQGKAETEVSFDFAACCTDDNITKPNHPLNTTVLEKKTCSQRTCEKFEGNKYASWVSTRFEETQGCNCCEVFYEGKWKLVQDGKVCDGIPNSKCCDGKCMVPAEDE